MSPLIHRADNQPNRETNAGHSSAPTGPNPVEASLPSVISSEALLRGHPSVAITHHGAIYRLQHTRQGKLILTK